MSEAVPVQSTANTGCERAPIGLLAELTHRCPLQCPYCSNPLALEGAAGELTTAEWQDVLRQAARLGALQLHLSGGEPTVRRDLEEIVATAAEVGLYTNLITAGVLLTRTRLEQLAARGLDHVQLSIQDVEPANADRIAHYEGAHAKKRALARWAGELGLPLTINAPVHRQNLDRLPDIIDFAVETGAGRLEVAHIQYYGWALANRAALMPTRAQVRRSAEIVQEARDRLKGILVIDFVVPDYYATWPKPCMGGWGHGIVNVTPSGKVLPCHAAETIPGLAFDSVRDKPLAEILAARPGVPAVPRHRLDDRAMPKLRAARDRLGRLPLPGVRDRRRCPRRRPCVRQVLAARGDGSARRARSRRPPAAFHLPTPAQARVTGSRRKPLRKPIRRAMSVAAAMRSQA